MADNEIEVHLNYTEVKMMLAALDIYRKGVENAAARISFNPEEMQVHRNAIYSAEDKLVVSLSTYLEDRYNEESNADDTGG